MYDVITVLPDAPDALEHVGSKRKFWYTRVRNDAKEDWLFKAARQNTGEDWAEKVAAEQYPEAATAWLHRLDEIDATAVEAIFDRIPGARISDASIDFVLRQLALNRDALLDLDF
jgi:hypothetical protein